MLGKRAEGLTNIILNKRLTEEELYKIAKSYINKEKGVMDGDEALKGAMDIIAEIISDNAQYRDMIRDIAYKKGVIRTKAVDPEEKSEFEMYYDYQEPIKTIANHRILAINRGEKKKVLKANLIFL